jgi:hypothetical protein
VRSAMETLRRHHGIVDPDAAFDVLRSVSQRYTVKLRAVAAAVVSSTTHHEKSASTRSLKPPAVGFSPRADAHKPNRTAVLQDLMRAAMAETQADYSTVQVREPIHGGLMLEGNSGFGRDFVDFFGYVDDGGSACGQTLTHGRQVIVDEVESSPVFDEPDRAMVLKAGVRSVVSTPLLDEQGNVWGVVSTHYGQAHRVPDEPVVRRVQHHADDCARWLFWYEATMMPKVLASVHATAALASRDG